MKIAGKKIEGPNVVSLYLPRGNEDQIEIKCKAVLDYDEFHKLCPLPKAPEKILKGGKRVPDYEHPNYKAQLNEYSELKSSWMVLDSLKATEGIEWETISYSDSSTWKNWEAELKTSGFSDAERQRIMMAISEANALNESKLDEARERFLSGQLTEKMLENGSTSRNGDQKNTSSGEHVKELVPVLQE